MPFAMRTVFIACVVLGLLMTSAATVRSEPTTELWRLCAGSSTIATGTLQYSGGDDVTLDVAETLKGKPAAHLAFNRNGAVSGQTVNEADLNAVNGRRVLVFLVTRDIYLQPGHAKTTLADETSSALRLATESDARAVRAEVARQARVVHDWRPHPAWPHRAAVAALIRKTLNPQTENKAFEDLEALGPSAVPAMVDLMDDRRPLGTPWISLPIKDPTFWEGRYIGKPELVVDAIAAILSNMTDEYFGNLVNGGSELERATEVSAWRVYVHDRMARRGLVSQAISGAR